MPFEQSTMGDLIYVVSEGEFEIVHELTAVVNWSRLRAGDWRDRRAGFTCRARQTVRARSDATAAGHTVQAFRERLMRGSARSDRASPCQRLTRLGRN